MKTRREASGSGGRDLNNDSVMRHKIKIFLGGICVYVHHKNLGAKEKGTGIRPSEESGSSLESQWVFFYLLPS